MNFNNSTTNNTNINFRTLPTISTLSLHHFKNEHINLYPLTNIKLVTKLCIWRPKYRYTVTNKTYLAYNVNQAPYMTTSNYLYTKTSKHTTFLYLTCTKYNRNGFSMQTIKPWTSFVKTTSELDIMLVLYSILFSNMTRLVSTSYLYTLNFQQLSTYLISFRPTVRQANSITSTGKNQLNILTHNLRYL